MNPWERANCNAPSATSITCGVFSITARATEMGCLMNSRHATEPMFANSSIMQASRVTLPSLSGRPP